MNGGNKLNSCIILLISFPNRSNLSKSEETLAKWIKIFESIIFRIFCHLLKIALILQCTLDLVLIKNISVSSKVHHTNLIETWLISSQIRLGAHISSAFILASFGFDKNKLWRVWKLNQKLDAGTECLNGLQKWKPRLERDEHWVENVVLF